jgi:hypothetical protein
MRNLLGLAAAVATFFAAIEFKAGHESSYQRSRIWFHWLHEYPA